ncbi:MAG: hypothetical protein WCT26_01085 [Candidatus Buchananbacteria bacterium]|jgi:hypothetical protein
MSNNKLNSPKNILTVGFISLLVALAAFSFSLWQTPSYKSTVKLLAVFNQSNIDTFTASKTANYITGILGEVIYSDSFIDSVYSSNSNLADNLGQGSEKRQKSWKKNVKTQILDNRGIVIIDVYGNDKTQTNLLASSIGSIIISQHGLYDGSQDRVTIKMIDTASVYESWSSAKIISDTGLGFLAGLLIGFTLIVIFPDHKLFEFKKKNRAFEGFPIASAQDFPVAPASYDEIKNILAEEPELTAKAGSSDYQSESAPNKVSNPWLDQYYEENSIDRSNTKN